ncbi:hypothetical protein K432DRAFT_291593, partial [Lepidopterella palustris CBS 459.81]
VRLLSLEPGYDGDETVCALTFYTLHVTPEYEAISYVWGGALLTLPISCFGGRLNITTNLR